MGAYNSFNRIQGVFEAESLPDELVKDSNLRNALELDNVSFSWDAPPLEPEGGEGRGNSECEGGEKEMKNRGRGGKPERHSTNANFDTASSFATEERPIEAFKIQKTSIEIPRGHVIAIIGPVGSGKSSFLQGLIGEMRKETGTIKFGGSISYCPQIAWIQVSSFCSVFHAAKWPVERHHP